MPSRTGIEFVDPDKEHWDIHHWVRGGCLYGVMPCNGLTYAPPHNCACYPEAKLFGFNALARKSPHATDSYRAYRRAGRLERRVQLTSIRRCRARFRRVKVTGQRSVMILARSGSGVEHQIDHQGASQHWSADVGGRITALRSLPVAQSMLARLTPIRWYALARSSMALQSGLIRLAPALIRLQLFSNGRVVFGGADGWVYCLTTDRRVGLAIPCGTSWTVARWLMNNSNLSGPCTAAYLIRNNEVVYCVAGRSNFIGRRPEADPIGFGYRRKKLSENIMDETNPETGNNLQEKLQILQMPVGLPDILSANDEHLFMKSQKFTFAGQRLEIGPNSGDFVGQVRKQRGPSAHIFAPMGFLDESWFHRSYWVLGQSFAGGHGGYYQAGRFAPSGRLLVQGNGYVFGYGRKPEYLRWTTTLEHQLFAADPNPPEIPQGFAQKNAGGGNFVQFPKSPKVDPTNKPITVEAWVTVTKPNGVIAARGGPAQGYALSIAKGRPIFHIRSGDQLTSIAGKRRIVGGWHHVAGVLGDDKSMQLYVDGKLAATGTAHAMIAADPAQSLEIGGDAGAGVGQYTSPHTLTGIIDEFRLYFAAATAQQIANRYEHGDELFADPVMVVTFDDGTARDLSLNRLNGNIIGGKLVRGTNWPRRPIRRHQARPAEQPQCQ